MLNIFSWLLSAFRARQTPSTQTTVISSKLFNPAVLAIAVDLLKTAAQLMRVLHFNSVSILTEVAKERLMNRSGHSKAVIVKRKSDENGL